MRESRTYGVVRGAPSNGRPYRVPYPTHAKVRRVLWASLCMKVSDAPCQYGQRKRFSSYARLRHFGAEQIVDIGIGHPISSCSTIH